MQTQTLAPEIAFGTELFDHITWIHGTSLHARRPEKIHKLLRRGTGTRLEFEQDDVSVTETWVHFAIPTQTVVSDKHLSLRSVLLNFVTKDSLALVDAVHVFHGSFLIASFNDLGLSGEHSFEQFKLDEPPPVNWGIGVSVKVHVQGSSFLEFRSAGAVFIVKTGLVVSLNNAGQSVAEDNEP